MYMKKAFSKLLSAVDKNVIITTVVFLKSPTIILAGSVATIATINEWRTI